METKNIRASTTAATLVTERSQAVTGTQGRKANKDASKTSAVSNSMDASNSRAASNTAEIEIDKTAGTPTKTGTPEKTETTRVCAE
jgi:hypothetical protein